MINLEASRQAYESAFADSSLEDIEANGIWDDEAFARVVADSRTTSIVRDGVVLPLITPVDNMPWLNQAWYRSLTPGENPPVYYYSHLSAALATRHYEYKAAFGQAIQHVAAEGGILAYDFPEIRAVRTDQEVNALIGQLGGVACHDLVGDLSVAPRHYHYLGLPTIVNPNQQRPIAQLDFYTLYETAQAEGLIPADSVTVVGSLAPSMIAQLWPAYEEEHAKLNQHDPVAASFTQTEFEAVLGSPDYVKLVRFEGDRVAHLTIVADVRMCPWLNQQYFRQRYPVAYEAGRVICGIGAITDKQVQQRGIPTVESLAMVARLIAYSGQTDVILPYATDNGSEANGVPKLTQRAMRRYLRVDLSQPMGYQVFRALHLTRA